MYELTQKLRQHLLTGVSYAIPFIACGGILIGAAIALAPMSSTGPDFSHSPVLQLIYNVGEAAFALMLPILAGYIAYSVAGKPALAPGFIGGYLSGNIKAGFLGALLAGLIAGYIVDLVKKLPVSKHVRPVMPILIIPIFCSCVVGLLMLEVVGPPIANLMAIANEMLKAMSTGSSLLLALMLGAMIAFDMGGPVNKTAFFFGAAMIQQGDYRIMGVCAAAICTPPLGMGVATLLYRRLWTEEQREAGVAGIAMGLVGVTEGAIPFAATDPMRVIPCIMAGSMTAAAIAMLGNVGDHAPHGGPIVFPVVDHRAAFAVAILAGVTVTSVTINLWKLIAESNLKPAMVREAE